MNVLLGNGPKVALLVALPDDHPVCIVREMGEIGIDWAEDGFTVRETNFWQHEYLPSKHRWMHDGERFPIWLCRCERCRDVADTVEMSLFAERVPFSLEEDDR